MVIITGAKKGLGIKIQKKLGNPGSPDPKDVCGIYRTRHRWGKVIQEKLPFYTPTNPQTGPQQNWRGIFSDAVAGWQALTDEQKNQYNEKAKYKNLSGYNLYISEYLYSH